MNIKNLFLAILLLSAFYGTTSIAQTISLQDFAYLQGSWKLENPLDERQTKFRLNYSFISRDSALVEVYGDPQKQTTQTIFHADQQRLMATHYCARGNQPRLIATTKDKNSIEFQFLDVTNLSNLNDPHMVRMTFKFIDTTHIEKEEVYKVNGKEESSTMKLVRAE
jgi:hypothetical protein